MPTTTSDHELLDNLRELNRMLSQGAIVRLSHERNIDQYTENLRDLGYELRDLGDALLLRVVELDQGI